MWCGWEDRTKFVQSKGNLEANPSDILSNAITGTWILYQYNWDQIVALHLDFKQACTTLWWLILFVAVQPNITRVNRSYYSALNLVFHGEVGDGDQGSSVLCTTVCNCLRCLTRSLNFPPKHQDIDHCQRHAGSIGSSHIAAAGAPSPGSVCAAVQSHSASREGHGLGGLPAVPQVASRSWHRLPSGGSCWRVGWDSPCLSSLAALSLALYAHHQFHLSEFVELSLLSAWWMGKRQDAEKSKSAHFSPLTHCWNFNVSFKSGPRFSGDRLTKWCWRRRPWISGARCRGIPHPQSGGRKMMQTYQEEGESNVHIHFQVSIVAQCWNPSLLLRVCSLTLYPRFISHIAALLALQILFQRQLCRQTQPGWIVQIMDSRGGKKGDV